MASGVPPETGTLYILELESPLASLVLSDHVCADDVGGHEVGSELYPAEGEPE